MLDGHKIHSEHDINVVLIADKFSQKSYRYTIKKSAVSKREFEYVI